MIGAARAWLARPSLVEDAWARFHEERDALPPLPGQQPEPPLDFDELQRQLEAAGNPTMEISPGWVRLQLDIHPDVAADLDLIQRRLNLSRAEVVQKALELLKVLSTRRSYTALDEIRVQEIR